MNLSRGAFRWDWTKFEVAMRHMNWHIDSKRTLLFRLNMIPGLWWVVPTEKAKEAECVVDSDLNQLFLKRALKGKLTKQSANQPSEPAPSKCSEKTKPLPKSSLNSKSSPAVSKNNSMSSPPSQTQNKPWTLLHMRKPDDPAQVRIANAPEWLLTACQSLDAISTEYPKTISVIAAVLVTVGSVPSLPVAAGTALASGTAHALGDVAVGLGSWIGAQQRRLVDVS